MNKPKVIFFDINETLLDLAPLKVSVGKALNGREDLLPLWFTTMLQYSMVDTVTENYHSFAQVGIASLMMVGEKYGVSVSKEQATKAIAGPFTSLPPHPDVKPSMDKLSEAGFKLISVTNSSSDASLKQLEFAGIIDYFDMRISSDEVKAFKPDPRIYQHAIAKVKEKPEDILMIAAHAWDLAGAKKVGLQTAFIQRSGATLYPNAQHPDFIVPTLTELADAIIAKDD